MCKKQTHLDQQHFDMKCFIAKERRWIEKFWKTEHLLQECYLIFTSVKLFKSSTQKQMKYNVYIISLVYNMYNT